MTATRTPKVGDDVLYGAPPGNGGPPAPVAAKIAAVVGGAGAANLVAFVATGSNPIMPLQGIRFAPCLVAGHWTWPEAQP